MIRTLHFRIGETEMQTLLFRSFLKQTRSMQFSVLRNAAEQVPCIQHVTLNDAPKVLELFKRVAVTHPNTLFRRVNELSLGYVESTIHDAHQRGIALLVRDGQSVVGYCKAYTSRFSSDAHVLADALVMIDSQFHGQKYGYNLVKAALDEVKKSMHHIRHVEILVNDRNISPLSIYKKFGFEFHTALVNRIRYPDGSYGSRLVLMWDNPNFSEESLRLYHEYLLKLNQ